MIRIFDGSSSCIKNNSPSITLKPLEERREVPVFGEDNVGPKIGAIFQSIVERFDEVEASPGPGHYNKEQEPNYILKGPKKGTFGSTMPRDNLLFRDITRSPFNNPTNLDNPGPDAYAHKSHEISASVQKSPKGRNS